MKQSLIEAYQAERERAVVTLYNTVRRFREKLDFEAERECQVDEETAALLQLMKEESEENDHE